MTDQELLERARKDAEYYGHLGALKTVQDLASALSASLEREKGMREALKAADAILSPGILGAISHWPEVKMWHQARKALEVP